MVQVPPPALGPRSAAGRLRPLVWAAAGTVGGVVWGAVARVWMRLLATGPGEFSWSGTLMIVMIFTIVGGVAGLVAGARRNGWLGWPMVALRLVGIATTLVLSLAQGAVMLPTLVLGSLATARRAWPTWLRATLAVLAAVPFLLAQLSGWATWPHSPLRLVAAVALGTVVYGTAVLALAQSYAPHLRRSAR